MKSRFLVLPLALLLGFTFLVACYPADSAVETPAPPTSVPEVLTEEPVVTRQPSATLAATEEPVRVEPTAAPTEEPYLTPTPTLEPTPTSVPTEVPMYVGVPVYKLEALRRECLKQNSRSLCLPLPAKPSGEVIHDVFNWETVDPNFPNYEGDQSRLLIPFSPGALAVVRNTNLRLTFWYLDGSYDFRSDLPLGGVLGIQVSSTEGTYETWVSEEWYKISDPSDCSSATTTFIGRGNGTNFANKDISLVQTSYSQEFSAGEVFARSKVPLCLVLRGRFFSTTSGEISAVVPDDLLHTSEGSIVYVLPSP